MKKFIFLTSLSLITALAQAETNVNPLSKITITSKRATCQKDKTNPQFFTFHYYENVVITFADKSTITANQLEVVFEGKDLGRKIIPSTQSLPPEALKEKTEGKQNSLEKFKKITISGNVTLISQNRIAKAQKAELRLAQQLCSFTGNVSIQQKKTAPKEVPITIESDQATLNLQTDELIFSGSELNPVNTVISLDDYEPLHKKKAKKRKP